jgi:hypothetical protein
LDAEGWKLGAGDWQPFEAKGAASGTRNSTKQKSGETASSLEGELQSKAGIKASITSKKKTIGQPGTLFAMRLCFGQVFFQGGDLVALKFWLYRLRKL